MLLSTQTRIRGGSSDTDVKELAVKPCDSPASLRIVTTATPVAKCPHAMRNWLASRLTGQAYKSPALASAPYRRGPEVEDLGGQPEPSFEALHEGVGDENLEPQRVELAVGCHDHGAEAVVAHGDDRARDSQAPGQLGRDLGQPFARPQPLGAEDVGGEVAVTELEPRRLAVALEQVQGLKAFRVQSPAQVTIDEARQGVEHGVDIGADVEAPELLVVPGVADNGERCRREQLLQSFHELHPADPTAQHRDALAARQRTHRK